MSESPRCRRLAALRQQNPSRRLSLRSARAINAARVMNMSKPHRLTLLFIRTLRTSLLVIGAVKGALYGWKEGRHDLTPAHDVAHPGLIMFAYVAIWSIGTILAVICFFNVFLVFVTPRETFRYYTIRPRNAIVINGQARFQALVIGWFASLTALIILGKIYVFILQYLNLHY